MIVDFNALQGLTFTNVSSDSESVVFSQEDGTVFTLKHSQDCCEAVWLEDVCGDLQDLVGTQILVAVESCSARDSDSHHETWTFYILRTMKGTVTLRFYGTSNGYYSESVHLWMDDSAKYRPVDFDMTGLDTGRAPRGLKLGFLKRTMAYIRGERHSDWSDSRRYLKRTARRLERRNGKLLINE